MRFNRFTRLALAAVTAVAVLATLALPAGALPPPPPPGEDPPEPIARPDLVVSALNVTPSGPNWQVNYTVRNAGAKDAYASTLGLSGGTTVSIYGLAAGASRSGSVLVSRNGVCWTIMGAMADSGRKIFESNEYNNYRQATGVLPPCPPRYLVKAVSFKALDESGIDGSGSDEPYWIFNTVSNGGTASSLASPVFGGIDSGDTQYFGLTDGCLYGGCSGGAEAPFGLGFSIQLWEKDLGHVDRTLYDTAKAFQLAGPILTLGGASAWVGGAVSAMGAGMNLILGWAADDLMGSNTYAYTPAYLASALPWTGASMDDNRIYSDGDADYRLTLRITRVV